MTMLKTNILQGGGGLHSNPCGGCAMKRGLAFLLAATALCAAGTARATTYYVAEDGSDANDGLSEATAKATISAGMA